MNIIHINAFTIDMITELNNGVRPNIESDTFFIWYKDEPAEIVSGHRIRRPEIASKTKTIYHYAA